MSILMPFSPLDAIIDCLPELRKAGKVSPNDTVSSVNSRMAAVLLPIVKRIQKQAIDNYILEEHRNKIGIKGS